MGIRPVSEAPAGARSLRPALAVLLGVALACSTTAAPPAAERMLEGLQRWLDGTRELEAGFEQSLESGALGSALTESGRMVLARPGRMRWEYRDPERKVALIENDTMSLYLAEDRQLMRSRIAEGEGDLLPRLLAGTGRLADLFEATLVRDPGTGETRLRLVPRNAGESFEEVLLGLRERDHAIQSAVVLDAAGNRMRYRFTDLRRNRGLPPDAFEFTPPPGTEIVEAR